ncbi:MAG: DUF1064 domain-containing protein [Exiguobacterium sp.]|nr:DUF1064 domain-containing protein [Exiguobacterium sp.]
MVGDKIFDSKKEADRFVELTLMEKAKAIQDLKTQVSFPLIPKSQYGWEIVYVADFTYYEDGNLVVEDVKSPVTKTPLYRLKKRLLAEKYNIKIREV